MCEVCRKTPCDYRCPNADEPKILCKNCDKILTVDDETYRDAMCNEFCSLKCALEWHDIERA